ncbi:hypothetical protein [Cyclobacterium lianum]|nr:hypothetical protein [Cyclobacterium lianum]
MINRCLICLLIGSSLACTNLKPIQALSEEALKGLDEFHEIEYSFTRNCLEDCMFSKTSQYQIERNLHCGCSEYQKADTLVRELYHALAEYWNGLLRLSTSEQLRYQLDGPANALQGAGWNQLDSEQLSAIRKLSEIGLNAVAGKYRKKKIRQYMTEAEPHLRQISQKLVFILENNLLGLLEIQKENWYMYYKSLLVDTELNDRERGLVTEKYYSLIDKTDTIRQKTLILTRILDAIAIHHSTLADGEIEVNSEDFGQEVRSMAKSVHDLLYDLEQYKQ